MLLEEIVGRLIIEDLFRAGSGGGFICPGVDGFEVEIVLLESLLKAITELIGLPPPDGEGIGGGVRRPGRMVDKGRFVVYPNKKEKNTKMKIKLLYRDKKFARSVH